MKMFLIHLAIIPAIIITGFRKSLKAHLSHYWYLRYAVLASHKEQLSMNLLASLSLEFTNLHIYTNSWYDISGFFSLSDESSYARPCIRAIRRELFARAPQTRPNATLAVAMTVGKERKILYYVKLASVDSSVLDLIESVISPRFISLGWYPSVPASMMLPSSRKLKEFDRIAATELLKLNMRPIEQLHGTAVLSEFAKEKLRGI